MITLQLILATLLNQLFLLFIMDPKEQLKALVGHKHIYLTSRGNAAIEKALEQFPKGDLLIADQGGWMSYRKIAKKLGFDAVELKTDLGVIDLEDLRQRVNDASAVLYQNPAGYFAEQPVKEIYEIAKGKVILDVSGCLGKNFGDYADVIIGSFGRWKIADLGTGGFISSNKELKIEENFEGGLDKLSEKLSKVKERLQDLYSKCRQIKEDLKKFTILHKDKKGVNVIVAFSNDEERSEILKYCQTNNYEWTECPREIRVNVPAISIEVKRL